MTLALTKGHSVVTAGLAAITGTTEADTMVRMPEPLENQSRSWWVVESCPHTLRNSLNSGEDVPSRPANT